MRYTVYSILTAGIASLISFSAQAQCTIHSTDGQFYRFRLGYPNSTHRFTPKKWPSPITQRLIFSLGHQAVVQNYPSGPLSLPSFACPGGILWNDLGNYPLGPHTNPFSGESYYSTHMPGVSIRISFQRGTPSPGSSANAPIEILPVYRGPSPPGAGRVLQLSARNQHQIDFVQTGEILTRGTFSGVYAMTMINGQKIAEYEFSQPFTLEPTIPTCQIIQDEDIKVGIFLSDFTGPGSKSSPLPFTVKAMCPSPGTVQMTFTDANDAANHSDTLSSLPSSTIAGLGVQIYRRGTTQALPLRVPFVAGNLATAPARLDTPFEARFVQVAPAVTAHGDMTARAQAQVFMNYQ